jgi:hypothetical protein
MARILSQYNNNLFDGLIGWLIKSYFVLIDFKNIIEQILLLLVLWFSSRRHFYNIVLRSMIPPDRLPYVSGRGPVGELELMKTFAESSSPGTDTLVLFLFLYINIWTKPVILISSLKNIKNWLRTDNLPNN